MIWFLFAKSNIDFRNLWRNNWNIFLHSRLEPIWVKYKLNKIVDRFDLIGWLKFVKFVFYVNRKYVYYPSLIACSSYANNLSYAKFNTSYNFNAFNIISTIFYKSSKDKYKINITFIILN